MQPRLLYPAMLSFKMEGEIKSFPNKRRLKEYISTKPALQEIVKGTTLGKERERETERGGGNTGTKAKNGNVQVPVNNKLKCKCSNQKTEGCRMDKKTQPAYVLVGNHPAWFQKL